MCHSRVEYSLEDVLDPEDLQTLESSERIKEQPDTQPVHWDDMLAVTTPGSSIASSMDRFKPGFMTGPYRRIVQGLGSEFAENNERVVFVDEDLKDLLGDRAMAVT